MIDKSKSREDCWNAIIEKYHVLEAVEQRGLFIITAKQIKEFKEPRLMTKFDDPEELPEVFRENQLTILSISRSKYVIGRFQIFYSLDDKKNVKIEKEVFKPNLQLESLPEDGLFSETASVLFAFHNNVFSDALELDNSDELHLTIYGRMGTKKFTFSINKNNSSDKITKDKLTVEKAQVEIDAGFESERNFYIVEAKNRPVSSINLRQLYYPYRLWSDKINK